MTRYPTLAAMKLQREWSTRCDRGGMIVLCNVPLSGTEAVTETDALLGCGLGWVRAGEGRSPARDIHPLLRWSRSEKRHPA